MTCLFSGIDLPRTPLINHVWICEWCKTVQKNELRLLSYRGDLAHCVHEFELDRPIVCEICGHISFTVRTSCSWATYHFQPVLLMVPDEKVPSPSGPSHQIEPESAARTQIPAHGG